MTDASDATPDSPPAPEVKKSAAREGLDTLWVILAGLAVALVLRVVVFEPYTIPSSSMEPGLVVGDYVVATKFPYGWSRASLPFTTPNGGGRFMDRQAERGDVVIFRLPRDPQQVWIKRVIGLPGDRVQMREGRVFINGEALEREVLSRGWDGDGVAVRLIRERQPEGADYITYDRGADREGDDTPVMVVPEGQYLVMGDHRDNSLDGRFSPMVGVGLLPQENLVGRADLILASWEPGAGLFKPWTWPRMRWDRFLKPVR